MDLKRKDVVFFDTGTYSSEGFTSGLLIFIRNILLKFKNKGLKVAIFSFVSENHSSIKDSKIGFRFRKDSNIDVFEYVLKEVDVDNQYIIKSLISDFFSSVSPSIIIMHTPAIFLKRVDILARQCANSFAKKVVHVLADELFPTHETHDSMLVNALYEEIKKGEVIGVSTRIRDEFFKKTGISSVSCSPVIEMNSIKFKDDEYDPFYIGMINIHPIKGVLIFDRVASLMPDHEFAIVKNWPDVPDYTPTTRNVEIFDFIKNTKDFYKKLRVLIIPSLVQEGSCMVAVEALCNGIPVIANNIGSIPEIGNGRIILIDPPEIKGYVLKGSVLFPVCDDFEVTKVSNLYKLAIEKVLSLEADNNFKEDLKKTGEKIIKNNISRIEELISKWSLIC